MALRLTKVSLAFEMTVEFFFADRFFVVTLARSWRCCLIAWLAARTSRTTQRAAAALAAALGDSVHGRVKILRRAGRRRAGRRRRAGA